MKKKLLIGAGVVGAIVAIWALWDQRRRNAFHIGPVRGWYFASPVGETVPTIGTTSRAQLPQAPDGPKTYFR